MACEAINEVDRSAVIWPQSACGLEVELCGLMLWLTIPAICLLAMYIDTMRVIFGVLSYT